MNLEVIYPHYVIIFNIALYFIYIKGSSILTLSEVSCRKIVF
jgi:hypothetical protein